jgi:tetrahydromethanopterin S-methyltransferase subunit C
MSRIQVFGVGLRRRAWALLALRLAFGHPMPTILLPGEQRLRTAKVAATAWFLCGPIVLPTMDDVVAALHGAAIPD